MNQVEVKILQQSYLLACKEGQESRLTEAVALVDGAMTRIHDTGKVRARERIAVLAALNLAYELGDLRLAHAQLLEQLPPPNAQESQYEVEAAAVSLQAAAAYNEQTQALEALVVRLEAALSPVQLPATCEHTEQAPADAENEFGEAVSETSTIQAHQDSAPIPRADF